MVGSPGSAASGAAPPLLVDVLRDFFRGDFLTALLRRFRAPVFGAAPLRPPLRETLFLRDRFLADFVATRRRPPFFDLADRFNVISSKCSRER